MSVIGRLDEQVDAILIAPLSRKDEPKEETATHSEQSAPPQNERAAAAEPAKGENTADSPLPVYLL